MAIDTSLYGRLQRLFGTSVIIRNVGGNQLKAIDLDNVQSLGNKQSNGLMDKYGRIHSVHYASLYDYPSNYSTLKPQLYRDYETMDTDAIISSALDVLADECTLKNENHEILQIRSSDDKIQSILYNLFYDILNIEYTLWPWIRNMCKYGDHYVYLRIKEGYGIYNVLPMPPHDINRHEGENPEKPDEVFFTLGPDGQGSGVQYNKDLKNRYENFEIAHFRLLSDTRYLPYGRAYIEPARKIYKQLSLMEEAMMIHRIMRAPEKRVFYINIGAIPPNEVEQFMKKTVDKMKKTPFVDPQTGEYNLKYNMMNALEDFYIPVRGGDATTRIDTAKGLEYNAIEDVNYLRDKLLASLKIPKAFFGYEKDLCIVPDTLIPLMNGTEKTVKELINDFNNGIVNYTYSIDEESNNIVPGEIKWAGYTRKDAELVRVTLDNEKYIDCTPDHLFMTRDGQWVEAQNLTEGQSLMPLYLDLTVQKNKLGYTTVYNPSTERFIEVHRLVPEYYKNIEKGSGKVVHHKDFDKKNNYPSNLDCSMTYLEHRKFHSNLSTFTINSKENIQKRISDPAWRLSASEAGKKGGAKSKDRLVAWIKVNGPWNKFRTNINCEICGKETKQIYDSRKFCGLDCRNIFYRSEEGASLVSDRMSKYNKIELKDLLLVANTSKSFKDIENYFNIDRSTLNKVFSHLNINKIDFIFNNMPLALNNKGFMQNYKKHESKYLNHKVYSVEFLKERKDTCDLHIESHHNFATSAGVIIHNSGKSTLAAEDIRFGRTIQRLQSIVVSELTRIALIHLYVQGYTDERLTNFELGLTTPSIIYEQEKIALWKEKVSLAQDLVASNLVSSDWIYDKIFEFSEDQVSEMRDLIAEDKKRIFRLTQIENEGNDPSESGESYGTPHDLASLYGRDRLKDAGLPDGYDETKVVGRPKEKSSIYGTQDSAFGRDAIGKKEMNAPMDTNPLKHNFRGGSPLSLKEIKEINIFLGKGGKENEKDLLSESNIKDL